MKDYLKNQIAITLGCNLFIVVPAGHGLGLLAMIEWISLFTGDAFSAGEYETSLRAVSLFSLVGQLILFGSLFIKRQIVLAKVLIAGVFTLFIGFFLLTFRSLSGDLSAIVSLVTGVPFIVMSVILLTKLLRHPFEEDQDSE